MKHLIDNKCAVCGSSDLMLALDRTHYFRVAEKNGILRTLSLNEVKSEEDAAVRLFCNFCGEHHAVPETLEN